MKTTMIKGMSLLALGFAFVACSHDTNLYDENFANKERTAEYQQAFTKAFGSIASNNQWGFERTTGSVTRQAVVSTNEIWLIPENFTKGRPGKEGNAANAVQGKFQGEYAKSNHGELDDDLEIDFDNYFLQHTDMPKNVKVSIECLEAYNSNSGDWEVVTNFGAGKNETDFRITATNLLSGMYRSSACTTLMKNMGGQPYNNVNDADDPANGKRFRVKYTNNTYNYNYYFLPYYEYYKNSSQQTKGSFLGFYFDGEVAPSGQESFWVIKIAAAQRDPNDLVAEGRVFCEDMGANDFDFNDVVFDAWIYGDGRIKIEILAHGGVLDIKVADRLVTLNQMTNTGLNEQDSYSYFVPAEEAKEKGWTSIAAIPVQVVPDKNANNDYDLTAQIGQAPQKVCVPINTEWPDEYVRLDKAYTPFSSYVNICNPADWTYEVVPFLVDGLLSNNN